MQGDPPYQTQDVDTISACLFPEFLCEIVAFEHYSRPNDGLLAKTKIADDNVK